ncbi:MAG: DUF4417 domain-containing protein [Treponema sp.]|nr:DUF4417 domain-containing protein [Treponema sp.]
MKNSYLQAYLVEGACRSKRWGFPMLQPCHIIPEELIAFSKTKGKENINKFVHFYEEDDKILPFGRDPRKYFPRLSQFGGVISCDFSVYRDMSFSLQISQTLWNRELTFWLQYRNISVIPNVRYSDEQSYEFCFEGIPKNSVISIGTHGCTNTKDDIFFHIKGLSETIRQLNPEAILFYGAVKNELKYILHSEKIPYRIFPSDTSEFYKNKEEKTYPLFDSLDARGA